VPDEWDIYPFWHLFNRKEITNKTQEQLLSVYLDRGVILHSEGGGMVHKPADNLEKYQLVEVNDFVMNNQQAWRGSVGVSPYKGIVSPAYLIFSFNKKICAPKFFKYFLRDKGVVDQFMIASMSVGTIQRQVKWHLLKTIQLSIPSLIEQNTIANFLDTETARIDNLISKQEKLIELLEEQRKSIISHAVTKGLNPNAPMKDSGVEWLGEVPEHWDVAVVKRAFIVKLGKMLQPDQKDETDVIKKYLKASNLTWDGVKDIDNEMWFSKNDLKKLKLEIGDLLVAEGGDVGKSCIFDSNEEFYYQNSVNRVRGQKNNANKFLYYWLFTLKYSGYIDILCNKSTIAHFTAEKLNETILLLPDSVEQNEIIAYLERENGKINQLILKQQSLIEKLKEYRASIISHAVTGKIDVMEFGA
jgi:type I restriction enzyme S subunit